MRNVRVKPVGHLVLIELADPRHGRLEHLRCRERVGCILRRNRRVVRLLVGLDELLIHREALPFCLRGVADGIHHAVRVLQADRLRIVGRLRRRRRLEHESWVVPELDHRSDQPDAVLERRPVYHRVRTARLDLLRNRVEVGGVGWVHLRKGGLDSERLHLRPDSLDHGLREGIIERRVGDRLRPLARLEALHPGREEITLVRGRRLLREEVVVVMTCEQSR